MGKKIVFAALLFAAFTACDKDDSFSTSQSSRLTFETDTLTLDTVFSKTSSSGYTFWFFNNSGDGIRLSEVKLDKGNQTGFRVNVDGADLTSNGYKLTDLELRKGDSIRVFVEYTPSETGMEDPQLMEDNLTFTLESGVRQSVNLRAWAWDAITLNNAVVSNDSTINAGRPVVVYGGITVKEGATLTLAPGVTLYFHDDAGIDVYGTLIAEGTADSLVTLRCDRIDKMFNNLPYDLLSGRWQGITFHDTSFDNSLVYADIHSAINGIVAQDSLLSDKEKLYMYSSKVTNNSGYGVALANVRASIINSLIADAGTYCLYVGGGYTDINACTLAQFYYYSAERMAALYFEDTDETPLGNFEVSNSIITGYSDDELFFGSSEGRENSQFKFDHCLINTPATDDERMTDIIYEEEEDTTSAREKNFVKVNVEYRSDYHLSEVSKAINAGNAATMPIYDLEGKERENADIGAYRYKQIEN